MIIMVMVEITVRTILIRTVSGYLELCRNFGEACCLQRSGRGRLHQLQDGGLRGPGEGGDRRQRCSVLPSIYFSGSSLIRSRSLTIIRLLPRCRCNPGYYGGFLSQEKPRQFANGWEALHPRLSRRGRRRSRPPRHLRQAPHNPR